MSFSWGTIPRGLTQSWLLLGPIRAESAKLRLHLVSRMSSAHFFSWSFLSLSGTTVLSFVLSSFFSFGCHVIFFSFIHTSVCIVSCSFWLWNLGDWRLSCLKSPWNGSLSLVFDPDNNLVFLFVCLFWLHPAAHRFLVVQPGKEPIPSKAEVQDYHKEGPWIRSFPAGMWSQLAPLICPSSPFHLDLCISSIFRSFFQVSTNTCPLGMYPKTIAS